MLRTKEFYEEKGEDDLPTTKYEYRFCFGALSSVPFCAIYELARFIRERDTVARSLTSKYRTLNEQLNGQFFSND